MRNFETKNLKIRKFAMKSDINKVCKFKFGITLSKVESDYMEEALKPAIDYLLNEKNFNVIISEFYDGCDKLTKIKRKILENVGMHEEALLYNRKIKSKIGCAENKVIYSIIK